MADLSGGLFYSSTELAAMRAVVAAHLQPLADQLGVELAVGAITPARSKRGRAVMNLLIQERVDVQDPGDEDRWGDSVDPWNPALAAAKGIDPGAFGQPVMVGQKRHHINGWNKEARSNHLILRSPTGRKVAISKDEGRRLYPLQERLSQQPALRAKPSEYGIARAQEARDKAKWDEENPIIGGDMTF